MFKAFTFYAPAAGTTPTEVTAEVDTDQEYEITLRVAPNGSNNGVYLYDSPTSPNGYFLLGAATGLPTGSAVVETAFNPEITLRLVGEKVYVVGNSSSTVMLYVIARSV